MTTFVHLDFEGAATPDIKDVGSYQWTRHPSHKILCAQYLVDDEPQPNLITYPEFQNEDWIGDFGAGVQLHKLAENPNVIFVAHNAQHEQNEWREMMVPIYGFPEIPIDRWRCSMALAYAHGLPGGLAKACAALKLEKQKDLAGHKVMMKLSRPRKDGTFWTPETAPEDFETLYSYCGDDVLAERGLYHSLRPLSAFEQRVWQIDQRINQTGVCVDVEYVEKAIALADQYHANLNEEFYKATFIESPTLRIPFTRWCKANGLDLANTQAATIRSVLQRENLPSRTRHAVEVFAAAGKTSLAKYPAYLERSSGTILREIYQYHGAHTGRWAGRGVQVHNLKRPTVSVRQLVSAILNHDYDTFAWMYGDEGEALASGLRPAIIARPGRKLYVGDYGQIESRVLAWLAGEESKLALFRRGVDVYQVLADAIGCDRQGGKVGDLSLGFGGGINAYAKMGRGYKIDFTALAGRIWHTATHSERKRAQYCADLYFNRDPEEPVSTEVAWALNVIKDRFRDAHPKTVAYWAALEAAAIQAVVDAASNVVGEIPCGRVAYFCHGVFLYCRLPSGRCLAYPFPKVEFDSKGRGRLTYRTEFNNQWIRTSTWGGTLAENNTQAVARDIMASALVAMEDELPWSLHTHDEGVVEVDEDVDQFDELMERLANPPCLETWAAGIPVVAAGYETTRYGLK